MKMKKKGLLGLLLSLVVLSGLATTVGTYAYWNLLTKTQDNTVNVGEGLEAVVAVNAAAPVGKELVPVGTITDEDLQVESVELTFDISLSKAVSVALDLSVVASAVKIGGSAVYASLVNIAIDAPDTLIDTTIEVVTVTVTLTEPATEVAYNAIHNQAITFTLTFTVAQPA